MITKETALKVIEANKNSSHRMDSKTIENFLDVINYVNDKTELSLINGYGLAEFKLDSRLASLLKPLDVTYNGGYRAPSLLDDKNVKVCSNKKNEAGESEKVDKYPEPKVTPSQFQMAQDDLFSCFKNAKPDYSKSLSDRSRYSMEQALNAYFITDDDGNIFKSLENSCEYCGVIKSNLLAKALGNVSKTYESIDEINYNFFKMVLDNIKKS